MVDGVGRELRERVWLLPLAVVAVLLVSLLGRSGMAGSGGMFESPTSPPPISPIPWAVEGETVGPSTISPTPSPMAGEALGPATLSPLVAVPTQPDYVPWILGGLVIIGGVVGVMLYRRRGDEG